jgi:hypothetical protein
VSWVATSGPRVVTMNISPAPEKTIKMGLLTFHAQHYIAKTKIKGAAGVIAPIIGKQPADIHIWIIKSEVPSFIEFAGQLAEGNPVWRIELAAPEPDATKPQSK